MRRLCVVLVVFLFAPTSAEAFAIKVLTPALFPGETPGSSVALGPDGQMWITTSQGRIARIAPSGGVAEFGHGITDGGAGNGLVLGGDGAMWFPESGIAGGEVSIGRATPAGVVTEYPSGVHQVVSIARGADGAVWYVGCIRAGDCTDGQRLGRIDVAGQTQVFPEVGFIGQLVLAADRQLWFPVTQPAMPVGPSPAEIGRISVTGAVTVLSLPNGVPEPPYYVPLVPGPGSGVWFSTTTYSSVAPHYASVRLGYITDAGSVVMLPPLGRDVLSATPVAPGPNGALWYSEARSNDPPGNPTKPGRWSVLRLIAPSGRLLAEDSLITNIGSGGMVAGPNHTLWFTKPLGEIVQVNNLQAECLAPAVTGSALGLSVVGNVADTAWWRVGEVGCSYRLGAAKHHGSARYPLVVVRQQPRPGALVPAGRALKLSVAPGPTRYGRCQVPAGSLEAALTRSVVLLRRPSTGAGAEETWGCAVGLGKLRHLFTDFEGHDTSTALDFRTAGDYVAFETDYFSHEDFSDSCAIRVVDLRTGAAKSLHAPCVEALAVSTHGILAWQLTNWTAPVPYALLPTGELVAHDSSGTHVLDATGPLDLANLHFTGDVVHWTDNGIPHQASLH